MYECECVRVKNEPLFVTLTKIPKADLKILVPTHVLARGIK